SELDSLEAERERLLACQADRDPGLPTRAVWRFAQQFSVITEELDGPAGRFPAYVVTPRGIDPAHTVVYVHGGGFVAGIDPFHLRYAVRLARALGARVVLPDYPLTPGHDWSASHEALADLTALWAGESHDLVLAGDSAGGGIALAVAQTLRDRGGPQASHLLLLSPWVDLTTSAPETPHFSSRDPWLKLSKIKAYAAWWAGRPEDLARPEVSPALGSLTGLPPTLMFCGTRDTLVAGCRLLAQRAAGTDWELTYVEAPDLIHVYPLLPLIPEARAAWRRTVEFLR
uniref:alpha/beta hydrolase n=1 Tax=Nocardioides sp. TaxID=35761 RepID=UPI003569E25C